MFKFFVIFLLILSSLGLHAKESLLTLKQQLDRLQREVSDLSESVYKGHGENKLEVVNNLDNISNLTAFDLRIYDLEKDIQNLNENFEELIFQIDDLKKLYKELQLHNSDLTLIEDNNKNFIGENQVTVISEDSKNILGTLVLKSEDLTVSSAANLDEVKNSNQKQDEEIEPKEELIPLKPEEEFQKAFDLIRNQKFVEAEKALEDFINMYAEGELTGSAHYWLGEIYLLKKEYREAALILAEGYQKFPKSFKAPDMLFKLSESLINIDKIENSCATLEKLIIEFPANKLAGKAEKKLIALNCVISE